MDRTKPVSVCLCVYGWGMLILALQAMKRISIVIALEPCKAFKKI